MSATQYCLFDQLPLRTTRLVCETHLPFSDRIQVSSPADVAGVLQEYFRDKDREEFNRPFEYRQRHHRFVPDQRRGPGRLRRRAAPGVQGGRPR